MDGIETARQIRKRIGKEITIIVLISYEFSEIEEEAKAAGVDAFIAKPLFRSRLTATLRQLLQTEKKIQREIIWRNCQKQIIQEKGFCWLRIMS